MTKKIDGRRETRGGDREDRRALLPPGRGGDGGGDDEEDRRERMPGCLALFSGWNKGRGTPTRRVADVPPPAPPALMELGDVKEHGDDKELQVADTTTIQAPEVKELPSEIDSKIVSMLDSVYDRSSLKAVCGRWRSATLSCPIAPLPLIINADYTLANCFLEGFDCVPKKMNPSIEHPPDNLSTCLGTLNNWIVVACEEEFHPQGNLDPVHNRCYLIQPIKGTTLSLPNPCSFESTGGRLSSLHILHGEGSFSWYQPAREGHLRLQKVALCRSAGHLNFRIAALATQRADNHIIFCNPDATSWTVSSARFVTIGCDLEFFDEKLFVLGNNQEELFVIEFGPHMNAFPTASQVYRCATVNTPVLNNTEQQRNLVRSPNGLLLVVRYFTMAWDQLTAVRVLELDTKSFTWREKRTLGTKSILISLNSSECIDASGHDEIKNDHIYFLDHFCPQFLPAAQDVQQFSYRSQVYSLRTGLIAEQLIGREPRSRRPGYPMWYFPTD